MVIVNMKSNTSWNHVAEWYDDLLETSEDSYQKNVILPNILRVLYLKKKDRVLDLACGQGFFSRQFAQIGAHVTGVDASTELITFARARSPKQIMYHVLSADKLDGIISGSFDAITIILALQNIKNIAGVFSECRRVIASRGRVIMVINHPAFRIPKVSSWGWDEAHRVQYRRVDSYLTESHIAIDMHPGTKQKQTTLSFHRPLQIYVNTLAKHDFAVTRMEEWISHRISMKGPRQVAENHSRKEIPLFLMIEARLNR